MKLRNKTLSKLLKRYSLIGLSNVTGISISRLKEIRKTNEVSKEEWVKLNYYLNGGDK